MKNIMTFLLKFIKSEVFKYLFFGVLTTLVSIVTRDVLFVLTRQVTFSVLIANVAGIVFAFFTNDYFVFSQERKGWPARFVKFFAATLWLCIRFKSIFLLYPGSNINLRLKI